MVLFNFIETDNHFEIGEDVIDQVQVYVFLGCDVKNLEHVLVNDKFESVLVLSRNKEDLDKLPRASSTKVTQKYIYFEDTYGETMRKTDIFFNNLIFGLLVVKTVYTPPISVLSGSIFNMSEVVARLCPPNAEVGVFSSSDLPMVPVHLEDDVKIGRRVTYYGSRVEMTKMLRLRDSNAELETDVYAFN